MKIKYYSTNKKSPLLSFQEALFQSQGLDKGLYLPAPIPKISLDFIFSMRQRPYWEIAFLVLNEFLKEEIPENELKKITKEAYNYDILVNCLEQKIYLMHLGLGPTASFKDFGARMLAKLMEYFLKKENKNLLILVATSGDTGSAVATAFFGLENIKVVILFPQKEITLKQRKQMTTLGKNIICLAVKGKFDDCQAIVKKALADKNLKDFHLCSANSINIGRLLPQIPYYFYAYLKVAKKGEEIVFSVPCGNLGNLTAGILAKKMGLPVFKFIGAVNENDEFPKFLKTGKYFPLSPSKNCISNSMNVGNPSNLSRLINLYGGQMDDKGKIKKMPDMNLMRKDIVSLSISDKETIKTIKKVYKKYKVILDPHGAVSWRGLEIFLSKEKISWPSVCLETAHPGKFTEILEKILGLKIEPLENLKNLETKSENFETIFPKYENFKNFLLRYLTGKI